MKRDAGIITKKMKFKVLTPTFIGGGEEYNLNKSQYIYDSSKNKVHVIDDRKLASFLSKRNLLGWYTGYVKDINVKNSLENDNSNNINIDEWFKKITSMVRVKGDLNECIKYTIDVSDIEKRRLNDISLFIKNVEGKPYIPGSSIKGSITSAILIRNIYNNRNKYDRQWEKIREAVNPDNSYVKENLDEIIESIYEEAFDYMVNDGSGENERIRGMSGLSISDTDAFDRKNLKLYQRRDLVLSKKGKNDLPSFRECLTPPGETEFSITIDRFKIKKDLNITTIYDVIEALDIQFELLYGKDGIFSIFDDLENMLPYIKDNKGLLTMGGGTGYLSKTIMVALAPNKDELRYLVRDLLHDERGDQTYNHKNDKYISPRTLKVSNHNGKNIINGICRIEVL